MAAPMRNWIAAHDDTALESVDETIARLYLADETELVRALAEQARLPDDETDAILAEGRRLVAAMRADRGSSGGLDAFMGEYDLSTREGVVLMCLAEALLRIPDSETADRLIADKLGDADFHEHLDADGPLLVNVGTWALMLTGRIVQEDLPGEKGLGALFGRMLARLGEPVIRSAMRAAMRIMSEQFVMGRTIEDALSRAAEVQSQAYRYSFDMLGEAALTAGAADDYFTAYAHAIEATGRAPASGDTRPMARPGVSVKLSALSPRLELAQRGRCVAEIVPRLRALAAKARDAGISLTVDAEEADRLEVTLDVYERVYRDRSLADWPGFGLAVQAYQKRGRAVVEWLEHLAASQGRAIPVRLVKGAYWDTEIKTAQIRGLAGFPVFTRKSSTDVSYLACARALIEGSPHLYPQFATHNAHTVAWIMRVGAGRELEFQRLHGMGEALYDEIAGAADTDWPCRVYAPVGRHEDLLPYLVRRLLENGANSSFVNRFVHDEWDVEDLVVDPVTVTDGLKEIPHPAIAEPRELFGATRANSEGLNLTDPVELRALAEALRTAAARPAAAGPMVAGPVAGTVTSAAAGGGTPEPSSDPADNRRSAGSVTPATPAVAHAALATAAGFFAEWRSTPAPRRADVLRAAADLLEAHRTELVMLIVTEAGRGVADALAEVREAVDFLRYYARDAEAAFADAALLPGPTGERNSLRLTGRGVFVCISPWNFPVAIFTGQIAAALAAGNTVIAKPAEQTPLVGARVVELLLEAGVPREALQFLPGSGPVLGEALLPDPRVMGVAFTGSVETAKRIERVLAARDGPIATLIAETGGVNAMLADSSALTEQVVKDAVTSAFNSAGQRCSALRLLCVQRETADAVIEMLIGRMRELVTGDPALLATDLGPVIDAEALETLREYVASQARRVLHQNRLGPEHETGHFFPPTLVELESPAELTREVFGPVLHVARYDADDIDRIVDGLNATGYGLTLGVHSRIDAFAERIAERARVGNIYVNRDMIGAVVGVQPFGGLGLSGTGPKAGGPHYLARFAAEQTLTINTAAVGGNTELLDLDAGR